jgi:hypothetical protein
VGAKGVCVLFELKVQRPEGSSGPARTLREELVAYVTKEGEQPVLSDAFLHEMHRAMPGPLNVDRAEVDRVYTAALGKADEELRHMLEGVIQEVGTKEAIVPHLNEFALAWVQAS